MLAFFLLSRSLSKILLKGFSNFRETIFHDLGEVLIPIGLSLPRLEPCFESSTCIVLLTIPSVMGCTSSSVFLTEVTEFLCASFLESFFEVPPLISPVFLLSPETLDLGFLSFSPFSMISSVSIRLHMSCRIIPWDRL